MADNGRSLTSTPNLLGLARILATPILIALLLLSFRGAGTIAFVVFALAAASDWLDGTLARRRSEVSPLGVFIDLTADKVLVGGVLVAMVEVDLLPTWMVATIIVRELMVGGVRQIAAAEHVVIPARGLGKAKTLTTLVGMAFLLLAFDALTGGPLATTSLGGPLLTIGFWIMVVATVLTVVSAVDYLRGAAGLLLGRASPRTDAAGSTTQPTSSTPRS